MLLIFQNILQPIFNVEKYTEFHIQKTDDSVLIARLFRKSETNKQTWRKNLLKTFIWGFYGLKVIFFPHKFYISKTIMPTVVSKRKSLSHIQMF